MAYLEPKQLPHIVRDKLGQLGIRRSVRVELRDAVNVFDAGSRGRRGFVYQIDLENGRWTVTYGSWGGPSPFERRVRVLNDINDPATPPRILTRTTCIIVGSEGGNRTATVYFHTETSERSVLAALAETEAPCQVHDECRALGTLASACGASRSGLDDRARGILAIHRALKAGEYRRTALREANVTTEEIDALVSSGYLSRNKIGAVTITTKGKNACEGVTDKLLKHGVRAW